MRFTPTKLFTIGFTRTSAESFFTRLRDAGVKSVIDVRLNNVSQLAGFAKRDDLAYFLKALGGLRYVHEPLLAPTKTMLATYRRGGTWPRYETQFRALLVERRVDEVLTRSTFADACLLCSEREPTQCHRRLVAEHLQQAWRGLEVRHL